MNIHDDEAPDIEGIWFSEADYRKLEAENKRLRGALDWLDNNTTYYLTEESEKPVLASVSKKIWYHATDDIESYPLSKVIDKALKGG